MTPDRRGQTQIDFLIGMSVFLLAVAFTFGFVPTMIEPFEETSGSDLQAADRSAAHLAEYALGSDNNDDAPGRPAVLNETCVEAFFNESSSDDFTSCHYESHAGKLYTALALDEDTTYVHVNISDDDGVHEIEGTELEKGDDPRSGENIAVSNRVVSINEELYELYVKVW